METAGVLQHLPFLEGRLVLIKYQRFNWSYKEHLVYYSSIVSIKYINFTPMMQVQLFTIGGSICNTAHTAKWHVRAWLLGIWACQVKKRMTKKSSSSEAVLQAKFNHVYSNAIETYPHRKNRQFLKHLSVFPNSHLRTWYFTHFTSLQARDQC